MVSTISLDSIINLVLCICVIGQSQTMTDATTVESFRPFVCTRKPIYSTTATVLQDTIHPQTTTSVIIHEVSNDIPVSSVINSPTDELTTSRTTESASTTFTQTVFKSSSTQTTSTKPTSTKHSAPTNPTGCPHGFTVSHKNSCYKLVLEPPANRMDARSLCESEASHLVFIEDEEENQFLSNQSTGQFWIGANGIPGDNFYWDDGTAMVFSNFNTNLSYTFDNMEGCYRIVISSFSSVVNWPDESCFKEIGYICEYEVGRNNLKCPNDMAICSDMDTVSLSWTWENSETLRYSTLMYFDGSPTNTKPTNVSRGSHHLVYGFLSSYKWCSMRIVTDCLKWWTMENGTTSFGVYNTWLKWHEGVMVCIFFGEQIATIRSQEENNFIQSKVRYRSKYLWIGVSYTTEEGTWQWYNSTTSFQMWATGEPNFDLDHCGAIQPDDGKWTATPCNQHASTICEHRALGSL